MPLTTITNAVSAYFTESKAQEVTISNIKFIVGKATPITGKEGCLVGMQGVYDKINSIQHKATNDVIFNPDWMIQLCGDKPVGFVNEASVIIKGQLTQIHMELV